MHRGDLALAVKKQNVHIDGAVLHPELEWARRRIDKQHAAVLIDVIALHQAALARGFGGGDLKAERVSADHQSFARRLGGGTLRRRLRGWTRRRWLRG